MVVHILHIVVNKTSKWSQLSRILLWQDNAQGMHDQGLRFRQNDVITQSSSERSLSLLLMSLAPFHSFSLSLSLSALDLSLPDSDPLFVPVRIDSL